MSIFFDFTVETNEKRFRRAVDADKNNIKLFWKLEDTIYLFGDVEIGSLIELSKLSLCLVDHNHDILGFVVFDDHPNIPSVDPADWEVWIRNLFQKFYLSRNTLFVHFLCCHPSVVDTFLDDAFQTVFRNYPYLTQIVWFVQDCCPRDYFVRYGTFKKFNVKRHHCLIDHITESAYHMYVAHRSEFLPKLKVRRAVEEDNDDVVEILAGNCPKLTELYGNFYISELIGRHPEMKREIIVAEVNDRAGGVMCINSDIHYKKIQGTYELGGFNGLRVATPLEIEKKRREHIELESYAELIMKGQCSPFSTVNRTYSAESRENSTDALSCLRRPSKAGKINFKPQNIKQVPQRPCKAKDDGHNFSLDTSIPISLVVMEDDPFDYEIVNIDNDLMSTAHLEQSLLRLGKRKSTQVLSKESSYLLLRQRYRRRSTICYPVAPEKTKYSGGPNAFIIELYGFREELTDLHGIDLLEGAYEVMPKYDYCVLQMPHSEKAFPLLQHFTSVPCKSFVQSEYCLYLAHRSSIFGKLRVRRAEVVDIPNITMFLGSLKMKETIWMIENTLLVETLLEVYLFFSGLSIVGLAIIEKYGGDIDFLRKKFNLDVYHNRKYHFPGNGQNVGFCFLKTALAYPVFEVHYRYFISEILRLGGCTSMVWMTTYRSKIELQKINSLITAMIPLVPRKFNSGSVYRMKHKKTKSSPVKAWFIDKKLSSLPKYSIDTRIVIIGASKTSLAFLNQLLFSHSSTYLTFNNVTLISNEGFPHATHKKALSPLAENMFPYFRMGKQSYYNHIPYPVYCHIVKGQMVEINKQEKFIRTASRDKYHYDLLFLLVGKQYQHPKYLQDIWEHTIKMQRHEIPYIRMDDPRHDDLESGQWAVNQPPENVFIINSVSDATAALSYIKEVMSCRFCYPIIVYGATIHAYCCITTLLDMKVDESRIIFVEPFPNENPTKTRIPVFANSHIDAIMKRTLEEMDLEVYRGYYFQDWTLDEDELVAKVQFISYSHAIDLNCSAFFYYGKRGVDTNAYIALHRSGICYDGGILIDENFRTRDPSVYAAGPATRYCGKIYAGNVRQKYYDSFELGTKLGQDIRNMLDPTFDESCGAKRRTPNKAGRNVSYSDIAETQAPFRNPLGFKDPMVTHCKLPGGYYFLDVRPPGLRVPHQYLQSMHYNGYVMETHQNGYFKLHFNYDFILDAITCLTQDRYRLENFVLLYGLPAVVLNNIHLRYAANRISSFYEFFSEPWAYFLYHDQRDELLAIVKELTPQGSPKGKTIRETLIELGERCTIKSCRAKTKENFRSSLDMSPYVQEITNYVIEWLSENDTVLPMYLQPWQVGHFINGVKDHPAFQKKKQCMSAMLLRGEITNYVIEWLLENDTVLPMYLQPWQVGHFINGKTTRRFRRRSNEIMNYVIEWLSENDTVLPMYLQPWQVGHFINGVKDLPAFVLCLEFL